MFLMYKAEIYASRGTVESLEKAIDSLDEAYLLAVNDNQMQRITERIAAIEKQTDTIKAEAAAAEAKAAEAEGKASVPPTEK
jgi:uncharacterized protein Yka (UPF0111/DUF47 family)